jgi:formamidopyrimidine-DNA glycosylase
MPELAEVEYYRKRWDPGLGQKIKEVKLHPEKRVFRNISTNALAKLLPGAILLSSEARGKRMVFLFSKHLWLGIHLGMTGKLRVERSDFEPAKHDHLVLYQVKRALVFNDPRLFGKVLFHHGAGVPEWWSKLPADVYSKAFTSASVAKFLQRHRRLPIKAALLLQNGFPGIGNWMADEILWRAKIAPGTLGGNLQSDQIITLWRKISYVSQGALKHVSTDFSDPPKGWLFHERWKRKGQCPIHRIELSKATIGGRTTAWCHRCQENGATDT